MNPKSLLHPRFSRRGPSLRCPLAELQELRLRSVYGTPGDAGHQRATGPY